MKCCAHVCGGVPFLDSLHPTTQWSCAHVCGGVPFLDSLHPTTQWTYREILERFLEDIDTLIAEGKIGQWNIHKYTYPSNTAAVTRYWIAIAEPQKVWQIFHQTFEPNYLWSDIEEIVQTLGKGLNQKYEFTTSAIKKKWVKKDCVILFTCNSYTTQENGSPDIYQKRIGRRVDYLSGLLDYLKLHTI